MARNFSFLAFVFILISVLSGGAADTTPSSWTQEAVRMTGESDLVRERALKRLSQWPHLTELLRQELAGPHQALALDVISALSLQELLPDLLKVADKDQTGFIYLCINNLLTSKNRDEIVSLYRQRLLCSGSCQASGPAQVVILDTLGRLGETLDSKDLQNFLTSSPWPEVRFAALDYVRLGLLQRKQMEFLPLLKVALQSQPVQLREQALYLISELPGDTRKKAIKDLPECKQGFSPDTLHFCQRLLKKGSS